MILQLLLLFWSVCSCLEIFQNRNLSLFTSKILGMVSNAFLLFSYFKSWLEFVRMDTNQDKDEGLKRMETMKFQSFFVKSPIHFLLRHRKLRVKFFSLHEINGHKLLLPQLLWIVQIAIQFLIFVRLLIGF